ncbi:hypothetical protein AMS68_007065 [Peltaster fructicola]|uniref:Bud22 domain-containing protein n=1 Tax=Peltaster fructicola TaxID=286661 RepID=A0A6H0Y3Y1_9PEZI|nr:hypothetical protein AMS68_007065 [Peltaster fructicola]
MPKRKRDFEEPKASAAKGSARQQRLDHKLDTGTRSIAHACKVAKGFERQKLGRREKTARAEKSDNEITRIQSEIAALKTLDTLGSARLILYKSLSKIKAVTASELFTDLLSKRPPIQQDPAAHNIHARLCNSKPVKEALTRTLEDVLTAAHIESHAKGKIKKKLQPEEPYPAQGVEELKEEDLQDDDDGLSDISGNEVYAKYEDRLASSEDEELASDEEDISRLEAQLRTEGVGDNTSVSGSEEESDFGGFEVVRSSKSRTAAHSEVGKPKSSLLLPSLTMGGYISASDSSEVEEIDVAPRKNRPGQRARQAIWEKKYGTKAKHLKDGAKSRDQGWDAKRGATGDTRRGSRFPSNRGADSKQSAAEPKPRKKDDAGPLHPSWVAAKAAKEKREAIPAFTGKKISFD